MAEGWLAWWQHCRTHAVRCRPTPPRATPPTRHPHPGHAQVYAELRRESSVTHGMPIAVRHLESMIRMSEARAAMHLREYVSDDDIDCAIRIMLESFVATQKLSVQKALRRKFRRFINAKADFNGLVLLKLQVRVGGGRRPRARGRGRACALRQRPCQRRPRLPPLPLTACPLAACPHRAGVPARRAAGGGHHRAAGGPRQLCGACAVRGRVAGGHRLQLGTSCPAAAPLPADPGGCPCVDSKSLPCSSTSCTRCTPLPHSCPRPLSSWRRQLEERCRDMDIFDLQPFYASPAFREAGFRLSDDGQHVLLARA